MSIERAGEGLAGLSIICGLHTRLERVQFGTGNGWNRDAANEYKQNIWDVRRWGWSWGWTYAKFDKKKQTETRDNNTLYVCILERERYIYTRYTKFRKTKRKKWTRRFCLLLERSGCIRECVSCVCNALLTSTHTRTHRYIEYNNNRYKIQPVTDTDTIVVVCVSSSPSHSSASSSSSAASASNVTPLFATGFSLFPSPIL